MAHVLKRIMGREFKKGPKVRAMVSLALEDHFWDGRVSSNGVPIYKYIDPERLCSMGELCNLGSPRWRLIPSIVERYIRQGFLTCYRLDDDGNVYTDDRKGLKNRWFLDGEKVVALYVAQANKEFLEKIRRRARAKAFFDFSKQARSCIKSVKDREKFEGLLMDRSLKLAEIGTMTEDEVMDYLYPEAGGQINA